MSVPYRRLSAAHWSTNNRERSLYNILAKAGVPHVPHLVAVPVVMWMGTAWCYIDALKPYEDMVSRGEKTIHGSYETKSRLQPVVNQGSK